MRGCRTGSRSSPVPPTGSAPPPRAGCTRRGQGRVADVDQAGGKALADRLGAERALFVGYDVTVEEQVAAAVGATVDHFGSVDVLVDDAGVNAYLDAETMTLQEWEGFFALDCGRAGCAAGTCCRTCGAGGAG